MTNEIMFFTKEEASKQTEELNTGEFKEFFMYGIPRGEFPGAEDMTSDEQHEVMFFPYHGPSELYIANMIFPPPMPRHQFIRTCGLFQKKYETGKVVRVGMVNFYGNNVGMYDIAGFAKISDAAAFASKLTKSQISYIKGVAHTAEEPTFIIRNRV